ncbi:DNA (cytosine-5-)-methyltransferase [Paenibacillus yanchengensis]|uniref:Cytosine-specific methyltransferase n=1 Tax=Paenibacillus yanchengensis TaxID=2035833 RepID=A0ABW4YIB6_9BACL
MQKTENAISWGGFRNGAGRKSLLNKKKAAQVYLDPDLKEIIDSIEIDEYISFSQKCAYLIEKGLESMSNTVITKPNDISKLNNNINTLTTKVRFIDLFAGLGGMRIGFQSALKNMGLEGESVFVSEIKKHAIESYSKNFTDNQIYGDITIIDAKDIPDFDFLLGGFPCQAFSSAGIGLGFEDTRGTLFFDIARIIKEKQPKGFLLENVEGLVTHDKGKTFTVIINTLEELGYQVSYRVLDGKDFGLAQSRKRIYIVGTKNGVVDLENFPIKNQQLDSIIEKDVPPENSDFAKKLLTHYSLGEVIGKQIKDKRGGNNNIHSWDFELKGEISEEQKVLLELLLKQRRNKKWASLIGIEWMDGMPLTVEMIKTFYSHVNLEEMLNDLVTKGYLVYEYPKQKVGNRRLHDETLEKGYNIVTGKLSFKYSKILDPNDVAPTLVATDISRLAIPVQNGIRSLTIREGLRLFGFPKDYQLNHIDTSKAYDLLGNTVCVPVIEAITERLLESSDI